LHLAITWTVHLNRVPELPDMSLNVLNSK